MIGRPLAKSFRFLNEKMLTPIKHYFYPKQFTFITLTTAKSFIRLIPIRELESNKVHLNLLTELRINKDKKSDYLEFLS